MPPKKSNGGGNKKKKALGVNRGFATVSVAKKEVILEVPIETPFSDTLEGSNELEASTNGAPINGGVVQDVEWSPEAMERHDLQVLMDSVRSASEKEISKTMKILDYEKRMSKTYPLFVWSEGRELQRRIIECGLRTSLEPVQITQYDTEEKVIAKVAALYGILDALGLTRIEECLRSVKNLDLEAALDWLFLRLSSDELECDGPILSTSPMLSIAPPAPPPRSSVPTSPVTSSLIQAPSSSMFESAEVKEELRARILVYDESDDSSGDEDEDPNGRYASLKLRLSELQRSQGKGKGKKMVKALAGPDDADVLAIQQQMRKVEEEYMFKRVIAEGLFRSARIKLDAELLSQRLASTDVDPSPSLSPVSPLSISPTSSTLPSTIVSSPLADSGGSPTKKAGGSDDGSDIFGNMLEEMPTETTNNAGITIPVYDMSLPKNYSGKTPQTSLIEAVKKLDRTATVIFRIVSRSRAVRAGVIVQGRTLSLDLSMEELACWDEIQARNYIATVGLFNLNDGQSGIHLPSKFKDLWDELSVKKREMADELYREKLKLFKSIAEPRLRTSAVMDIKPKETEISEIATFAFSPSTRISAHESEKLRHDFWTRQQWPSYQSMLRVRGNLPIAAYRDQIMATIDLSQCVVLCGETGCGKSTQVPSFILEHELAQGRNVKVYCTEPRRISAISLAQRVSSELGEAPGSCGNHTSLLGYTIRLDSKVSASSRIIYATTGIMLRMLEGESMIDATHIIIDEVHERSIDSDFLLIVLKQLLKVKKDLKVILMSATVDAEKIASYMGNCPVITVPGRTFPVTRQWLEDVIEMTQFRLTDPHSQKHDVKPSNLDVHPDFDDDNTLPTNLSQTSSYSKATINTLDCMDQHAINYELIVLLLEDLCFNKPQLIPFSAAILIFMPSLESIRRLTDLFQNHPRFGGNDFLILPLHSTISNENQGLVFDIPPSGVRKIVISTNLAETGVTIPDITAVIDTGKHREMRFDEKRQVSRLVETFIARSNASQRRGRAGRVQEGICFALFSKQRHEQMAEHPQPEILRLSLQDLALRIKIMKIGTSIEAVLLQALDPPSVLNIQRAIVSLVEAKALTTLEEITPLGRHLAKLPMDVHLGKFLIMSCLFGCLDAALTITATLNSKSPWVTPFGRESEADAVKRSFKVENSDFLTVYNAFCSWRDACANGKEREFTRKCFLSHQNLQAIEDLRQQYFSLLVDIGFAESSAQDRSRRGKSRVRFFQIPPHLDSHSKDPLLVTACLAASMYPKILIVDPNGLRTLSNNASASIHPSSVNSVRGRGIDFNGAKYITFFTAMQTKKLYVWESGSVEEKAIYLLCGYADFQLSAHSLSIDRKIRTRLEPKTGIAFKLLRNRFTQLFNMRMKNPSMTPSETDQEWFSLMKHALVSQVVAVEVKKERVKMTIK